MILTALTCRKDGRTLTQMSLKQCQHAYTRSLCRNSYLQLDALVGFFIFSTFGVCSDSEVINLAKLRLMNDFEGHIARLACA